MFDDIDNIEAEVFSAPTDDLFAKATLNLVVAGLGTQENMTLLNNASTAALTQQYPIHQ